MGRIVLFLVLALVAYFVIRAALRGGRRPAADAGPPESMVPCRHCGVNLPASEAIREAGHFYCSEEHRRLGAD